MHQKCCSKHSDFILFIFEQYFLAKQRIHPSVHPDLCLATIPPGGRSGGWDRSIWEERTPSGRSWRACPPTSSCRSEKPSTRGAAAMRSASARSPRPRRPTGRTRGARTAAPAAPGGTGPPRPASRGGAAAAAAGGSPPSPAPSWSTAASRSPPGSPSSGSCATTFPSCARPSCAASPTRRPSSGGTACSPQCPATRTGSCCATPSGLTRPTSTTRTSPWATGMPRSAASPRQKLCICVAVDVHKNPVAVACGHGKPSTARVRKAMGGRIAPGSLLIHDLERAHDARIRDSELEIEAHRADVNDPVYLERMEMVNDMRSRLKRYLWRFTGMSPRNLQAYLD